MRGRADSQVLPKTTMARACADGPDLGAKKPKAYAQGHGLARPYEVQPVGTWFRCTMTSPLPSNYADLQRFPLREETSATHCGGMAMRRNDLRSTLEADHLQILEAWPQNSVEQSGRLMMETTCADSAIALDIGYDNHKWRAWPEPVVRLGRRGPCCHRQ
jgi:hypothetical protein